MPTVPSAVGGAASGAASGAALGPIGAIGGAAIGAVSSAFGGKQQAKAIDKAARLQAQAQAAALAFQREQAPIDQSNFQTTQGANYDQYKTQQERLRPYQEAGAGAAAQLRTGLGLPEVTLPRLPTAPVYESVSPAMPPAVPPGAARGIGGRVSDLMRPNQGQTASSLMGTGRGLVTMRAPDGEIGQVPPEQVDYFIAKGATVVRG